MRLLLILLAVNLIALGCAYSAGNSLLVLACLASTGFNALAIALRLERQTSP